MKRTNQVPAGGAPLRPRLATTIQCLLWCCAALLTVRPHHLLGAGAPASPPVWSFERDGDLQGWQPNQHLTNTVVKGGVLRCTAVGSDPILVLEPRISLPATPWQYLQVRMRADHEGVAELFWSNTAEGRYGGFAQEKSTRFPVRGDGQWHVYHVFPCWQTEGTIVRLRFDLYDAATFEIDSMEVASLALGEPAPAPDFDFVHGGALGWRGVLGASVTAAPGGPLRATMTDADSSLIAPPTDIDAADNSYVSLRMSVDKGRRATIWFATDKTPGMQTLSFPIKPGAAAQTYNLDMLGATGWRGHVLALGLKPSDIEGAKADIEWCRVTGQPQGEGQPVIVSWSVMTVPPRAGVPTTLEATISNTGGEPLTNLVATLRLPADVRLATNSSQAQTIPRLNLEASSTVRWQVLAAKPLRATARLTLTPQAGAEVSSELNLDFTPRIVESDHTGYVPTPKPVRGPYEVGAYYFPGWKSASQWHPIERFPERRPLLGWYREGDPEIADWHIKWAVEHGITFFAYDWYWSQGTRQLEHGLHDGFFKARYRNLLKFCLLWANHNAPGTSSKEDCVAVTRFWIENYFRRPEHLLVDGKPLMIIFSPTRFTEDMGSAGVRAALGAMREECVKAGLKGLYLTACVGDTGAARQALAEGYDAVTAYNWPHLGLEGGGMYAPFEPLVPAYRRQWENILANAGIPLVPLPICGGWDSRPWHGDNNLVRYGRTPDLFRKHMRDARDVLDHGFASKTSPKLALVEAWNEWGEGSYIEPHAQYGFGFLDAIRETFTDAPADHQDPTPIDLGLGPYDVAPEPPSRTAWSFAKDTDGWNNTMDMTDVGVTNGVLQARSTGNDPAFFSSPIQAQARDLGALVFRMRLTSANGTPFKDSAQVFWRTSRLSESEASSQRFDVSGDGAWHDYRLALNQNKRWRGLITRLRLDPCNRNGVKIEIADLRLLP